MDNQPCGVALKEWSVTCRALQEGRQIILLRKGGILDELGTFALEHTRFWLQPTYDHQNPSFVLSEHRDLFATVEAAHDANENQTFIRLQLLAEVAAVYQMGPDQKERLRQATHIWSRDYLDLRFGYRPEKPLLCVALRVLTITEPPLLPMRDEYFGCRSWIALDRSHATSGATPVIEDADFAERLATIDGLLKS